MALATNLSFVTVMDAKVVHKDITNGNTYAISGASVELPFGDPAGADTDLDAALLAGTTVGGNAADSVVVSASEILISVAATDIVTLTYSAVIADSDNHTWTVAWSGTNVPTAASVVLAPVDMEATAVLPDYAILATLATLECLTIANITQEGPRKEVRAGREAQPCIRYGKTMRLEMESVIFNSEVLATLGGATVAIGNTSYKATDIFPGSYGIIGDSYVVNKTSGEKELIWVTFSEYLPDGVYDITMESEGDIGMFNLAGELFPNVDGSYYIITEKTV